MTKPDYTDFYRFVASVGLILMGLGPGLYWLFLQDSVDVQLTASAISALTSDAQAIVQQRQALYLFLFHHGNKAVGSVFLIGLITFFWGSYKWYGRQKQRDRGEDADTEKKVRELEAMTPSERKEKAKKDVPPDESGVRTSSVSLAQAYEDKIAERFKESGVYEVKQGRKLNSYQYDIILLGKTPTEPVQLIEIRYFSSDFDRNWFASSFAETYSALQEYRIRIDPNAQASLVLITSRAQAQSMQPDRLLAELGLSPLASDVHFVLVSDNNVASIDLTLLVSPVAAVASEPQAPSGEDSTTDATPERRRRTMSLIHRIGAWLTLNWLPASGERVELLVQILAIVLAVLSFLLILSFIAQLPSSPFMLCPTSSFCYR